MKHFLTAFLCILLSCAVLVAAAYGIFAVSSYLGNILSPKSTSVNNEDIKKTVTVILDAGHGGIDGGAVGARGTLEKDLNLDVAKKLSEALTKAGVKTLMTRTEDVMLTAEGASSKKNGDLRARLQIAEGVENCLFVSIHMNKFPDSSVKGMTFYYSPNHPESRVLAEAMRQAVVEKLQPENKRPLKEAGSSIYLLHRITRPAVLVECGFLSNAYEESLLASEEYRERMAGVLAEAILSYLDARNAEQSS